MNTAVTHWAEQWARSQRKNAVRNTPSFWDKRAPEFRKHQVAKTEYAEDFIRFMQLQPHWSVLDVGCGCGNLALPLAKQVALITALDFSPTMLELLQQGCVEQGVDNITTIHGRWEDDWDSLGVGRHDVAIASRSLAVSDLPAALSKLNQAARRQVYVTAMVGDGPHDKRVYQAIGRPLANGPDYIYLYNILHEMGIYANVSFITNTVWNSYDDLDEAIAVTAAKIGELTADERTRLQEYLMTELVSYQGKLRLPEPRVIRWAIIYWDKGEWR
ncbi:class I SAM-dependent methyltransferase [Pelobacter seleniigenes]|uniref:class I SAM-dependent methyltransferase n=1 Tax=Pelobacter seleniigenes TaxID=407188 RepID=UPI00055B930A|nr:class I SAM-dependent methyltransferase [Pelobacter seleniigenes]